MNSLIGYEIVEIVSKGPSHAATVELVRRPEYGMFETMEEAQEVSKQLGQGFSIADIQGAA